MSVTYRDGIISRVETSHAWKCLFVTKNHSGSLVVITSHAKIMNRHDLSNVLTSHVWKADNLERYILAIGGVF